jgi:TolB-like protein
MISDLSGTDAYRVVERERLEDVLGELKLQRSAHIDQASAVKAGKLLGAHYLVLGSYFDVMKQLRVDARIVEVETGRVLQSVGATGQPEDFVGLEQKLATDLGKHLTSAASWPRPSRLPAKPRRRSPARQAMPGRGAGPARVARPKPPKRHADRGGIRPRSAIDVHDLEGGQDAPEGGRGRARFELASLDLNRLKQ